MRCVKCQMLVQLLTSRRFFFPPPFFFAIFFFLSCCLKFCDMNPQWNGELYAAPNISPRLFGSVRRPILRYPPKKQRFSLTNVSWLLDTKKGAIIQETSLHIFCLQSIIENGRRAGKGHRISGDTAGSWFLKPAISLKKCWGGYRRMTQAQS